MKKNVKLKMTSSVNYQTPEITSVNADYSTNGEKHLISFHTDDKTKISLIAAKENRIKLITASEYYDYSFEVAKNEKTVGLLSENRFFVNGKNVEWKIENGEFTVLLKYTIIGLSDEPMRFNTKIQFTV